ncbi:MAG: hypothetical protein HEP71_09695 [Roseivirga sp.]|nr:hypothetical protein [Roseivirga sp.]
MELQSSQRIPLSRSKCISCNVENTHVVVSASYAHIFWVPLFPYKKKLTIVCANCGMDTKPKEVSLEVKQMADQLKSSVRIPFYMFSGTGIIALLIGIFAVIGFMDDKKIEGYLDEPQVNDIYYLYDDEETSEYKFYLGKVIDVRADSVDIQPNTFHYNYKSTRLEPEDGFYGFYYTVHKSRFSELFDENVIRHVMRGFDSGAGFEREIEYTEEGLPDPEGK